MQEHQSPVTSAPGGGVDLPYGAAFHASPWACGLIRQRDGCLLDVNQAWLDLIGRAREEVLGRTMLELGHWPGEAPGADCLQTLAGGQSFQTLRRQDGTACNVRMHTTRLDGSPEPLFLVCLLEVLAPELAQRTSEAALRESNRALQQQVELYGNIEKLARVGYWTNAADDQEVIWSPGLFDITGLPMRQPLLRSDARAGIFPEDLPRFLRSRQTLDGQVEEYRWRRPDGQMRWLRSRMGRTKVAGNPQTDFGVVQDITVEHEATLALKRQHLMQGAIHQAQTLFIDTQNRTEAFQSLLDALLAVTGSAYGVIGELLCAADGRPYLKIFAMADMALDEASRRLLDPALGDEGIEFRNLNTWLGQALLTAQPVLCNDPRNDPRAAAGALPGEPALDAFLGLPIKSGDELVALVGLANQPGGYSAADVELLQPALDVVRQLLLAWRGQVERERSRRQLEATSALLEQKSADLQIALDSMNQGLGKMDASGRMTVYNRRLLELLELPQELLAAQPRLQDVVRFQTERGDFGAGLLWVEPKAGDHVERKTLAEVPQTYWRKTRAGRTLEVQSRQLPDGGMVRTFADVSSYIEVQEALARERQRLQWVIDATHPGIWELHVPTGALTINERWAEMLGYTLAELTPIDHAACCRLVHPEDLPRAEALLAQHTAAQIESYECDLRMRHKRGHWVWVNDRGRVHQRDASGAAIFMSGTQLDISERMAAQEQVRALNASLEQRVAERTAALERSMQDMEEVAYSIAHDLRTPLRAVNGFAALIAEEEGERLSPLARDMFVRIVRTSGNLGQLLTDMLELLRVVRVAFDPLPVDLRALAQTAVAALGTSAESARIDLQPVPLALGDASLLGQMLIQLMDNALKYARQQPQPLLQLGFDADEKAYYLRDNGCGFDMAHADKLFGLFQRLHPGVEVPGTGVGLAIVQRIVERHGGRVWATSAPGAGAVFWWTLPSP